MTESRRHEYLPYALASAIALLGILSAVRVLYSPDTASAGGTVTAVAKVKAPLPAPPAARAVAPVLSSSAKAEPQTIKGTGANPAPEQPTPGHIVVPDAAIAALVTTPLAPPVSVSPVKPAVETPAPAIAAKPKAARATKPVHVAKPKVVSVPRRHELQLPPPGPALQMPSLPAPGLPPSMHGAIPPLMPAAASEGPRAFAPTQAASTAPLASSNAPAATRPARAADTGPTVVAASGSKVWIRLDERRTVSVDKGQSLEGYGAFIGVSKGIAKFERGSIASKAD